jgi:transcriptional regulator
MPATPVFAGSGDVFRIPAGAPSVAHLRRLVAANSLATVIVPDEGGTIHAVHLPLVLAGDDASQDGDGTTRGVSLLGHMARENPQWQRLVNRPQDALVIFRGVSGYVSPSWYPEKKTNSGKVVPTWNYEAVHVRGVFELVAPAEAQATGTAPEVRALLSRLTAVNEAAVGTSWKLADAPEAYVVALCRDIVAFRLRVTAIEGVSKLSQNKTPATRQGVIAGASGCPATASMGRRVREAPVTAAKSKM